MAEVPGLITSVDDLASALEGDMPAVRECVGTGRGEAHLGWSMYGWDAFVDFPTWLTATEACLGAGSTYAPLLDAVSAHLSAALPYVRNTHGLEVKGAGGIGVFFPGSQGAFLNNVYWHGDYFLVTQFAVRGWYAFLEAYWGGTLPDPDVRARPGPGFTGRPGSRSPLSGRARRRGRLPRRPRGRGRGT